MDSYTVKTQHFEGPFDLLLYFIQRDELDINDIPIARITADFLQYIKTLESLNLDVAAEFILVAATLMRIKAKMLIPRKELDEEGNEIDPRKELIQKLVEYKRYKEILSDLEQMADERATKVMRGNVKKEIKAMSDIALVDVELESVSTYKLFKAFQKVLERYRNIQDKYVHKIVKHPYTVKEEQDYLKSFLRNGVQSPFDEVFADIQERMQAIVRFLALLELINSQEIIITDGLDRNNFWLELG
ncbi:MAG: segregation/condensation protein A [Bacteroidia bacterium]|nr:segregation/condensation protein A [Bacteroidia bacterium]MBT8228903.1 segregation/condensation protein A [Bacteroidia bacterium]